MQILRTPEDRFRDLPGFPFAPRYLTIGGMRVHYVDEGRRSGDVVLLLHGEPTWSYLYRKVIPILAEAGYRCIAPDLVGFGRSDKLARPEDHSYLFHVEVMKSFVEMLDLDEVTLVGQDWGGLIGLRVVAEMEERFARVVAANTVLPTGSTRVNHAFFRWREFSQAVPEFDSGYIVKGGTRQPIEPAVLAAYNAPFPDETYKAGARILPKLVPTTAHDPAAQANEAAWEVLKQWDRPFLTVFSDQDPIMAGGERVFQRYVPGSRGQPHTILRNAGHFLQEDKGEELAELIVDFIRRNPIW